jgi:hypothetical protein
MYKKFEVNWIILCIILHYLKKTIIWTFDDKLMKDSKGLLYNIQYLLEFYNTFFLQYSNCRNKKYTIVVIY